MTTPAPAARTFILRVWLEPGAGDRPETGEWRGELKGVPGGETAYFRGFDALPPVLRRLATDGPADAGAAEAEEEG
jgi:hypothetical protein